MSLAAPTRFFASPSITVPRPFSNAVRAALRGLHETRRLTQNPLLATRLVAARAPRPALAESHVAALRDVLFEEAGRLQRNARTEPMYRALYHAYLEPSASQVLAAEAARMSFGTYRRHLAAGTDEVATSLWLREQTLEATAQRV